MRPTLAALALTLLAADWPQWLGPTRDGASPEIVRPWTGAPPELWRAAVGEGHSSPVVVNGKVYLHYRVKPDQANPDAKGVTACEIVSVFDAKTGRILDQHSDYQQIRYANKFGNGPRATPAYADGRLVTLGVTGQLTVYDTTGPKLKPSWAKNILQEFGAANLYFGTSSSPVIDGARVIVMPGAKDAGLVALHRDDGRLLWKSTSDAASYAAPVVADGRLIALTQAGVVAVKADSGEPLWRVPFADTLNESSTTPVRLGNRWLVSSVTRGSALLEPEADLKSAREIWKNPALCCYFSTPIAVGADHVYLVSGSLLNVMAGKPEASLCCVETATGKVVWTKPGVGKYHASLMRTGDQHLLMLSDDGALTLVRPDPAGYREVCRAKICGETWAHPALCGGTLFLRDDRHLIALRIGDSSP